MLFPTMKLVMEMSMIRKNQRGEISVMYRRFHGCRLVAALLATIFLSSLALGAGAQPVSTVSDPAAVQQLLDEALQTRAKIVVIEAGGASEIAGNEQISSEPMGERLEARAFEFRDRLTAIFKGVSGFADETVSTLRNADEDKSLWWIPLVALFMTIHLSVGYGVERLFRN